MNWRGLRKAGGEAGPHLSCLRTVEPQCCRDFFSVAALVSFGESSPFPSSLGGARLTVRRLAGVYGGTGVPWCPRPALATACYWVDPWAALGLIFDLQNWFWNWIWASCRSSWKAGGMCMFGNRWGKLVHFHTYIPQNNSHLSVLHTGFQVHHLLTRWPQFPYL